MSQPTDAFSPALQQFAQLGQAMTQQFFTMLGSREAQHPFGGAPINVGAPDPAQLAALQQEFVQQQTRLWNAMLSHGKPAEGGEAAFEVHPEPGDRRFSAPEWKQSPIFDYIRQSYLLNARYLKELVEIAPVEDDKSKNRLRFLARQYLDAVAPSNFAATNPEFVRLAVETKGRSITDGINNLIRDFEKGRISMTDDDAFEVGRNLATTPGAVIYENEVMQLIQYSPLGDEVAKRPLVIVPPCINKFYILDLQAENSFVRYAVEQGNTVFLVSWRNPQADLGHLGWNDYLENGPLTALAIVREVCKVDRVNALGFCVGGTVLTSSLAVLAARGEDWVASLTLLTTLLDFSDTGEIGLFIDEQSCATRDATIGKGGLLTGRELASTFSALRANDLIWNYVSGNYLKGQKPPAFDLLYWNSDSTNLPGPFAAWYMRNLYLNNSLRIPGKLEMCGAKVDLGRVRMPAYLLATREDHIVPWQSAYQSTRLLGGPTRFVLGASGHIAGVINPAAKNKRSFWVNDAASDAPTPDADGWLAIAEEKKGSWWNDWAAWLAQHADGRVPARAKAGNAKYKAIEPAPGRYVRAKA